MKVGSGQATQLEPCGQDMSACIKAFGEWGPKGILLGSIVAFAIGAKAWSAVPIRLEILDPPQRRSCSEMFR